MKQLRQIIAIGTLAQRNDGRNWIKISNNKWIPYSVYVAKQHPDICGDWYEGCEVHHIDFDRTNDNPFNLICLSKEEHHQIHRENNKNSGNVIEAFKDGKLYGTFPTEVKCAEHIGIPSSYINLYIKTGRLPQSQKYQTDGWEFKKVKNTQKRY